MLRVLLTGSDGHTQPLHALTVSLDGDTKVPADSLTVTCPFDNALRQNAAKIEAYDGERLVFSGKPDKIVTEKRTQGAILRFSARSPAAALLDNEAEPITYFQPTVGLMESRHLAPFGIRVMTRDNTPYYDALKIVKGMSHWQVLQSFCRNRFQCEPRVTGDGRAYLNGEPEDGTVFFSDTGGVRYFALTEYQKPHCLLSEVRLKFEQANAYHAVIENTSPAARGVRRVRYVNAASDKTTLATAEKMLENSNRSSYSLRLRCLGCQSAALGKRAAVQDSVLGLTDNLLVRQVSYTADSKGERSVIVLEKEKC